MGLSFEESCQLQPEPIVVLQEVAADLLVIYSQINWCRIKGTCSFESYEECLILATGGEYVISSFCIILIIIVDASLSLPCMLLYTGVERNKCSPRFKGRGM